jgi:CheY-like chemotaxis protein
MSRTVLLVEPDLDALGTLASRLRSLGLTVVLADSAESALERGKSLRLDALLVSDALPDARQAAMRLHAERALDHLPIFLLVDGDGQAAGSEGAADPWECLRRGDVDGVAKRLYALSSRPPPSSTLRDDFRGDLGQVSVLDLLQLLGMNRRTGSVTITTPSGVGEVRLAEGDVVDAVYRRLEAEKALYRLLGEQEGSFMFASGFAQFPARMATPTNLLLMEGLRQLDEVRRVRTELALDDEALLALAPPVPDEPEPTRRVLLALTVPRTLDELLDEVPLPDQSLLEAVRSLLNSGEVRRVPKGAVRTELADSEQLAVLGALATRLRAPGYSGPARLLLAVQPWRMATLTHALQRIADAVPPPEPNRSQPLPQLLATLRLVEGAELDIVGLPTAEAYAPVWELALPGAAAVVGLGGPESSVLGDLCAVAGRPLLDAGVLVGNFDEADPEQVAALVRAALDTLASG